MKIELTLNTLEFKDSKSDLTKKFWFDSINLKNLKKESCEDTSGYVDKKFLCMH